MKERRSATAGLSSSESERGLGDMGSVGGRGTCRAVSVSNSLTLRTTTLIAYNRSVEAEDGVLLVEVVVLCLAPIIVLQGDLDPVSQSC